MYVRGEGEKASNNGEDPGPATDPISGNAPGAIGGLFGVSDVNEIPDEIALVHRLHSVALSGDKNILDDEELAAEREARIDALLEFQRKELEKLLAVRKKVDAQLRAARESAAAAADYLSAARALVAARAAGAVLHEDPSLADTEALGASPGTGDISAVDGGSESGSERGGEVDGVAEPIGVMYTALRKRWEAPRQSFVGAAARGVLVLREHAALHTAPGDRLVLLYWLDRNGRRWRTHVRPPRRVRTAGRVGVLATRSPHRPTPVGLSLCVVERVNASGTTLHVSGLDVLDETPVLSVRLYTVTDAIPDATAGWLQDDATVRPLHYDAAPAVREWEVAIEPRAAERLDFVEQRSCADVRAIVSASLARGAGRCGVLPIGAFRILFETDEDARAVRVVDVVSGFREAVCLAESGVDPEALLHAQFKAAYPKVS